MTHIYIYTYNRYITILFILCPMVIDYCIVIVLFSVHIYLGLSSCLQMPGDSSHFKQMGLISGWWIIIHSWISSFVHSFIRMLLHSNTLFNIHITIWLIDSYIWLYMYRLSQTKIAHVIFDGLQLPLKLSPSQAPKTARAARGFGAEAELGPENGDLASKKTCDLMGFWWEYSGT